MASKFHRNAIITGYVNSFCLACECFLRTEFDVTKHMEKSEHQKTLNSYPYFEKYKNEHIRKVKKGYYCEFCNFLMATAAKVNLHVVDVKHTKNKGAQLLKPSSNSVMAFGEIIINEKAWHSLMNNTCAICNTEFEDEDKHKTETTHLLNLVQSEIEFGENNGVYRKIDESSFQCLTCNTVFALKTIAKHFSDPEHKTLYHNCRTESKLNDGQSKKTKILKNIKKNHSVNTIITQNKDADVSVEKLVHNDRNNETKTIVVVKEWNKNCILGSIARFQKDKLNINFESEIVFCRNCFKYVNFDFKDINVHIEEHKKYPNNIEPSLSYPSYIDKKYSKTILLQKTNKESCSSQNDTAVPRINQNHTQLLAVKSSHEDFEHENPKSVTESLKDKNNKELTEDSRSSAEFNDLISFAKQNNISYCNNYTFCLICQTKLSSSLKSVKEHVSGKYHKSKAGNFAGSEPQLCKTPLKEFVDYTITIKNGIHRKQSDQVINDDICISFLIFLMITKYGLSLRCQLCKVNLSEHDASSHAELVSHRDAMMNTPVITSIKSEFVREVCPGLFHCGYCNLILQSWIDFTNHIMCAEHKKNKTYSNFRLEKYKPAIVHHKREENIKEIMMLSILFRLGW